MTLSLLLGILTCGGTAAWGATTNYSPASLTFGNQAVGTTSSAQLVTFTNTGSSTINFGTETITGDFTWGGVGTCRSSLAAGSNCTMSVKFDPTATGTRTGSLTVDDNADTGTQVVSLSGTGGTSTSGATLSFSPTSLTFASQAVGTISSAQLVTFTNTGGTTINFGTETITGDFTWGGVGTCGSSLAAGSHCTMSIKFKPTTTGTRTGSLTVNDNASGSTQVVSLTGTGGTSGSSAVSLSPNPLSFGNQTVNTTSSAKSVTIKNSGTTSVTLSSISTSGNFANAGSGTCATGKAYAAGASCTVSVKFTPAAAGTRTGTLTVKDNAGTGTQTDSLTGTGVTSTSGSPSITTTSLPGGTVGQSYSATLAATGGKTPYSWIIASGSLPGGLSLGASTGVISGTPSATGQSRFTVQVSDSSTPTQIATKAFSVTIGAASSNPPFGHIVIVVEENTNYANVVGSSAMPYLNSLIGKYGLGTQYYANTHPSIGNYMMLTTGQVLTNNDSQTPQSFPVSAENVVTDLVAAGKTWKSYAESLPSIGYTGGDSGEYVVRHNPLAYMANVQNNSALRQNLVPFSEFSADLSSGNLPNYSFVVPNVCDDAHDCSLSTADSWLQANIQPLVSNAAFQKDGLLIVVFDESGSDNTNGGGRVAAVLVSPAFSKVGYKSTTLYQHQSILRLTLEGLGVTKLPGAAATAPKMWEFFTFPAP